MSERQVRQVEPGEAEQPRARRARLDDDGAVRELMLRKAS